MTDDGHMQPLIHNSDNAPATGIYSYFVTSHLQCAAKRVKRIELLIGIRLSDQSNRRRSFRASARTLRFRTSHCFQGFWIDRINHDYHVVLLVNVESKVTSIKCKTAFSRPLRRVVTVELTPCREALRGGHSLLIASIVQHEVDE